MIDGDIEGSFAETQACHGVQEDSPKGADHVVRTSFANDLRRVLTGAI
jgi:hypothetical protein